MSQIITAIVEGGRLRPTVPLDLAEGAEVKVMILPAAKPGPTAQQTREALARIAALPEEGDPKDKFSGRDHDHVLYSGNRPDAVTAPAPRTSWPCQAGSAKDTVHWMSEDFDAPLDDFKDYAG
jgi:predicted DNA-binding antitoxin AbrB/MazE fold protein